MVCFLFFYKLSVFWTFHTFAIIIFSIIISESSLLYVNFFSIALNSNLFLQEELWALIISNSFICLPIALLEHEKLDIEKTIFIGFGSFFFGLLSIGHLDFLMKNGIFNYLIIHLSLYMEAVIVIVLYYICYIDYKLNEKMEKNKRKKIY